MLPVSKIAVVGSKGMLGKAVVDELQSRHIEVIPVDRNSFADLQDCEGIINCAGAIPQKSYTPDQVIQANCVVPHWLSELAVANKMKLLLVSTDCVFDGKKNQFERYSVSDSPNPTDLYGRTKLVGEIVNDYTATIRTSFIGLDHGFLRWLVDSQHSTIEGWRYAYWTGSTVWEVAARLVDYMLYHFEPALHHLATVERTDKYNLACMLSYNLSLKGLGILPNYDRYINRALAPTIELNPVGSVFTMERLMDEYNGMYSGGTKTTPSTMA